MVRRLSQLLALLLATATLVAAARADAPRQYWGINLDPGSYVPVYANLVRHCQFFAPTTGSAQASQNVALDQFCCPTTDFVLNLKPIERQIGANGDTYAVSFPGRATLSVPYTGSIASVAYNSATNATTAVLTINNDPNRFNGVPLVFTNTRRLPSDTTSTGIDARSLCIMRPVAPGASTYHATTEKFNRQLKVACAPWSGPFGYWRDLDAGAINGVALLPVQTPANRTMPFNPLQCQTGATGYGMSLEDRIELANFLGCGWWNNFPDNASDDLRDLTVALVKFGSDSTGTPYTGATGANPWPGGVATGAVHAPLAGIFLFEMSNEVWNTGFQGDPTPDKGGDGGQLGRYGSRGKANYAALNANGEVATAPGLNPLWCQVGADLLNLADRFKAAFPGGLGTKYFPILSGQSGNLGENFLPAATWLQRRLATRGETIAQNIAAGGGATYEGLVYNPAGQGETAAIVFGGGPSYWYGVPSDGLLVNTFGIAPAAYEGGLEVGDDNDSPLTSLVNHDARLRPLVRDRDLNAVNCGFRFVTTYALIRGAWSILDSIQDLTHPKYLGHCDAIARYPCDGSAGYVPPAPPAPAFADPSFEAVRLGTGSQTNPSGFPWTFTYNGGVSQQTGGFVAASQAVPLGLQAGFIQTGGSIEQTVPGWAAGRYTISGLMCQRATDKSAATFQVIVDGATVGNFTPQPLTFVQDGPNAFQAFSTGPFSVSAGSHHVALYMSVPGDVAMLVDGLSIASATAPPPVNPAQPAAASVWNLLDRLHIRRRP